MLSRIVELFQVEIRPENNAALDDDQKRLACAALLIEVATVDNEFDDSELKCLQHVLSADFNISVEQSEEIITLAQSESANSTSMYQFTQLVNQHCSPEDKFDLVVGMWKIAFADGELDKYEEYIIRKISDLIYIPHSDFIRAKHLSKNNV